MYLFYLAGLSCFKNEGILIDNYKNSLTALIYAPHKSQELGNQDGPPTFRHQDSSAKKGQQK